MKILYLHGLGGTGFDHRYAAFVNEFGEENVISPNLPLDPDQVESMIDRLLDTTLADEELVIIVGISLGGFWANYMARKWDLPCVLVNPAARPTQLIQNWMHESLTRLIMYPLVFLANLFINKFLIREKFLADTTDHSHITIFVAKDDAVLNYQEILDSITSPNSIIIKEDGGHKFDDHWPEVVVKVKELMSKEVLDNN